jgi:hypothetical protein
VFFASFANELQEQWAFKKILDLQSDWFGWSMDVYIYTYIYLSM